MKKVNWDKTYEKYTNKTCVGGIDLSIVRDMSVWVLLFPMENNTIDIVMRAWVPESQLHDNNNRYKVQYQKWVNQGYLDITTGNTIDYVVLRKQMVEDFGRFNIYGVNIDAKFQGIGFHQDLCNDLLDDFDSPKIIIPFTTSKYAIVCEEFQKRLSDKQLNHGNNPVLRHHADNIQVKLRNVDGRIVPDKGNSQGKIDGIIGILLALNQLIRLQPPSDQMPIFV